MKANSTTTLAQSKLANPCSTSTTIARLQGIKQLKQDILDTYHQTVTRDGCLKAGDSCGPDLLDRFILYIYFIRVFSG